MATNPNVSQAETDLQKSIREVINEKVNRRLEVQIKLGNTKIDQPTIEKACTEEFFKELEQFLNSVSEDTDKFLALLKQDDVVLYEKIAKKIEEEKEDFKSVKNFHELSERGHVKRYEDVLLDKVYDIGAKYYGTGDFPKAYLYFCWLTIVDAENPQMWFLKGVIELNLKMYDKALASLYQVLTIDPGYVNVYTQIMNCLILMEDFDTVKTVYKSFLQEVDPRSYEDDALFKENLGYIKQIVMRK